FQIISRNNTLNPNPILPAIELLDSSGNLVAFNVSEFESTDSTLLDVTLPTSGSYYVGVLDQPISPPGDYQLFMYSFATTAQPSRGIGDTLVGGSGNDTLVASPGNDLVRFPNDSAGNANIVGGSGRTLVNVANAPRETYTITGNVTVVQAGPFATTTTVAAS